MRIGNRIPHEYFLTEGVGESDITVHAGSYHLALRDAGIEMANHIMYSSILPASAVELPKRPHIVHGEVMETITATATCEYGSVATAGLIFGWLYHPELGDCVGGLVCEYGGSMTSSSVEGHLKEMLGELHQNGYEQYELRDETVCIRTVQPEKMYGTALVAICFCSYTIPIFKEGTSL